jgi:hypothetical protein
MMIDVDNGAEIGEERMATMRLAGSVIAVLVSPTAAVHAQMMIVGNDQKPKIR